MGIQEHLNKIRNAVYGREVRESIAKGIETAYDDASEKDNANMEVKIARGTHPNLRSRLEEVDNKQQQVTAQLQQKATKGEIKSDDLSTASDNDKIKLLNLSEEVQAAMAGKAPVISNVADGSLTTSKYAPGSVTLDKLNPEIVKNTINVFDKNTAKKGYFDYLGVIQPHATLMVTEKISVKEGDVVNMTHMRGLAQYDSGGAFIREKYISESSAVLNYTLTIPAGTSEIAMTFDGTKIDEYMVVINEPYPLEYIPFKKINMSALPESDIAERVLDKIAKKTSNAFDKEKAILNRWLQIDGSLAENVNWSTTHRIRVTPGDTVRMTEMRTLGQFDYSGKFITDKYAFDTESKPYVFVIPSGTYSIAVSFKTSNVNTFMLTVNNAITKYEPYYKLKDSISQNELKGGVNLPKKIYATVGKELTILNRNITREKEHNVDFNISIGKQMDNGYLGTFEVVGQHDLVTAAYEKDVLISSQSSEVIVSETRNTNIKVLIIGDSTVNNGRISEKLKTDMGENITLLGTRGVSPNLHEGRGGWTANMYLNVASFGGLTNPFYSPTKSKFDLAHYLATTGQVQPDVIIWQLGINDTFNGLNIANVLSHFDGLINAVKSTNPNVKQAINITIPPTDSQDKFGEAYGTGQTQWQYKYNNFDWVQALINHYDGKIDLIPTHISLDTTTMIDDGVHPTSEGYDEMAKQDEAYLNSI